MNREILAEIIQKRRNTLMLKQEDLAEMAGVNIKTIYLIEKGKGNPSVDTLNNILEVLGLEMLIDVKKVDL